MVVYPKANSHEEIVVGNNLDQMIRRSGMTNTAVAEEKGIKRETLSRHKSGVINISRHDAEEYAQILNCLPQQIMYQSKPIPCLGKITYESDGDWFIERDKNAHWYSQKDTMPCLFLSSYFQQHTVCLKWDDDIEGIYEWMSGAYFIFSMQEARLDRVDQQSLMKNSLIRERTKGQLMLGQLYPQPGSKKFTVFNGDGKFPTYEDVDVEWSAPLLSAVLRPDLRGAEIVEVPKDEIYAQGKWCNTKPHWSAHTDKYS